MTATPFAKTLHPRPLDGDACQLRRYGPDPTKVMLVLNGQRWVFDAAELLDAIHALADMELIALLKAMNRGRKTPADAGRQPLAADVGDDAT